MRPYLVRKLIIASWQKLVHYAWAPVGVRSKCAVRSRYAVDVGVKRSTHTVDLVNMGCGDRYHTMGYTVGAKYAVGAQYAVGVSAKRSNHTVDLVNVGGGDHYL